MWFYLDSKFKVTCKNGMPKTYIIMRKGQISHHFVLYQEKYPAFTCFRPGARSILEPVDVWDQGAIFHIAAVSFPVQ